MDCCQYLYVKVSLRGWTQAIRLSIINSLISVFLHLIFSCFVIYIIGVVLIYQVIRKLISVGCFLFFYNFYRKDRERSQRCVILS